jgi:hypothetical protein
MQRNPVLLVLLLLAAGGCVGTPRQKPSRPHAVELLRDTDFANGIRVATRTNYPKELQAQARARWQERLPTTAASAWEFIEIAELLDLSHNPDNPQVNGDRILYTSEDGSKRFVIDGREGESIRFVIDTEREWRNGCNLAGQQDGADPVFCKGKAWNWPHFLLSQYLRDPLRPEAPLELGRYPELRFSCDIELVEIAVGEPNPCPPDAWGDQEIPNHALFYVDLVLFHRNREHELPDGNRCARVIYPLFPVFYTWDGATHTSPDPWLGEDPAGSAVYFTPNPEGLVPGRPVRLDIDFARVAREALTKITDTHGGTLSANDYTVSEILLGWEIWGPFRCDMLLGNLSLVGVPGPASGTVAGPLDP